MQTRRNALLSILCASLVVAVVQERTVWSRVAVMAAATAVLIDAGAEIAGWVKASKE